MSNNRTAFQWDDPLFLDAQLTEEERMVRDAARDYAQGSLCLLYTSPSPRDQRGSRMPSSA